MSRKNKMIIAVAVVIGMLFCLVILKSVAKAPSETEDSSRYNNADGQENNNQPTVETVFNKKQYSLTEPTSIWVIVNKQNSVPISFSPDTLTPDVKLRLKSSEQQMQISSQAANAVKEMFDNAKLDDVNLVFGSGYRSANLQREFYDSYVAKDGQAKADTYSARPGFSEHQTGLAFDITSPSGTCHLEICWENTAEGKWVALNAYKYGFIMRYPNKKESITGYQYEPWHFRYVGKELANQINQTGQTLEEFFEYPAAPNY